MPLGHRVPRPRRALLALAAVGCAALFGAGSSAHAGSGATTTLSNDVVHNLSLATLNGSLPASQPVTVGVFLSNPNQAAEDAYVKQLYDPSSPNYGNYLDPDTFNTEFGVPASNFQATQSWLQGQGLTVTSIDGATDYMLATGSAGQIEAAFGTQLNNYTASGRSFYANTAAPTVPASLGISDVLGLNSFNRLHIPQVQPATGTTINTTETVPSGSVPKTGELSIRDLWSIYDAPSTNMGNGQSMAIFGWGVTDPVIPDLRSFEAEWGLPGVPITVKRYGDTSTPDTSGDGATTEWELDTQASTGMAPNVTSETLYFAHHNSDTDALAAFAGWVNDKHGPLQGSASFGECENVGNANAVFADGMEVPGDKILEQAAAEGRTLFSSTGDTGSSCPVIGIPVLGSTNGVASEAYPGLNWPSASPWAVAVGGTDLTGDGNTPEHRFAETAWEFTGGGNSTSEPAGSYQQGVASTNCTFDPNGNPYLPTSAPLCRSTPDVAAISGDVATGNGLEINDDNGPDSQGAGTSLSSPLWLGVWARIQAAAKSNKGLGFANYEIYKLAKSSGGRDFYDVTVGDNQPYPATPGYDNTTGWGTPEISQIMQDLTGRLTPTHNTTPAAIVTSPSTTCGSLFTDPAGDDNYSFGLGAGTGANPQLDILSGRAFLSADGQTLKTIITVNNLSTVIPTGGGENDYQMVFTFGGNQYFTQLAVEPTGTVLAWDGELVKVSLENKYLQEHSVTGTITLGPNGTAEVDAPVSDFPGLTAGTTLLRPGAATYVREGVNQGPLEPADSGGPTYDDVLGTCTS
ncbi:MAG TPA: S53 family peptidase [Gaiellaceae bacterium]|nr:S53 family peptidase [Gaiellaceae bacterium]